MFTVAHPPYPEPDQASPHPSIIFLTQEYIVHEQNMFVYEIYSKPATYMKKSKILAQTKTKLLDLFHDN
jgi:hypothetical protein